MFFPWSRIMLAGLTTVRSQLWSNGSIYSREADWSLLYSPESSPLYLRCFMLKVMAEQACPLHHHTLHLLQVISSVQVLLVLWLSELMAYHVIMSPDLSTTSLSMHLSQHFQMAGEHSLIIHRRILEIKKDFSITPIMIIIILNLLHIHMKDPGTRRKGITISYFLIKNRAKGI